MQLKFISLGLIAGMLASVSARSLFNENSVATLDRVNAASNTHLVARCASGCCNNSCGCSGGGNHGDHGDHGGNGGNGGNDGGHSGGGGSLVNVENTNIELTDTASHILENLNISDNLDNPIVDILTGGGGGGSDHGDSGGDHGNHGGSGGDHGNHGGSGGDHGDHGSSGGDCA